MVSIIVPIYNAEKYLKRCILSLLTQSYSNLEIILVNDGSTDSSEKICESAALHDSRIRVINTKNQGVSMARNEGLKLAKGDFFSFVDADDYVEKSYIEKLVTTLKEKKVDIVYCSAVIEDECGNIVKIEYDKDKLIKTKNYDWNSKEAHCVVRGAIYPKGIIKNLKFNKELFVGEDTYFFAQCLKKADYVYCIKDALYHYIQYKNSIYHSNFNENKITEIDSWLKIIKLFNKNDTAKVACAIRCKGIILRYAKNRIFRKKYFNQIINIFRRYLPYMIKYYFKRKNFSPIVKNIFFGIMPNLYIRIRNCQIFCVNRSFS